MADHGLDLFAKNRPPNRRTSADDPILQPCSENMAAESARCFARSRIDRSWRLEFVVAVPLAILFGVEFGKSCHSSIFDRRLIGLSSKGHLP